MSLKAPEPNSPGSLLLGKTFSVACTPSCLTFATSDPSTNPLGPWQPFPTQGSLGEGVCQFVDAATRRLSLNGATEVEGGRNLNLFASIRYCASVLRSLNWSPNILTAEVLSKK